MHTLPPASVPYWKETSARWISSVISPHVVGVMMTIALAFTFSQRPVQTLAWLVILVPLVVVPPFVYIMWLVHRGTLEDIYMPDRRTRLAPLIVIMGWMLLCLMLIRYWQVPFVVEFCLWAAIVLTGILSLITLFWKISFHSATIATASTTATLLSTGFLLWPTMLLIPLVCWARVRLNRHTPGQVAVGSLIGCLLGVLIIPVFWYYPQ